MLSEEDLRRELAALEKMTAKELRGKYRELFGDEGNRQWLFRRCAWRLQARRSPSKAVTLQASLLR